MPEKPTRVDSAHSPPERPPLRVYTFKPRTAALTPRDAVIERLRPKLHGLTDGELLAIEEVLDELLRRQRAANGVSVVSAASFTRDGRCVALHGADEYLIAPRALVIDHLVSEALPPPLAQVFQYGITYALARESYRFEIHLSDGEHLAGFHVEMTATDQGEVVAIFRVIEPNPALAIAVTFPVGVRSQEVNV